MAFSINCLEINPNAMMMKKLLKNLSSKRYFFNDFYIHDETESDLKRNNASFSKKHPNFYGLNINIQAIVGLNGSGKSTILDLIYIIVNNFSYMYERGHDRKGADPLYFVNGIDCSLYYSIDDVEYMIKCKDESVSFKRKFLNDEKFKSLVDFKLNDRCFIEDYGLDSTSERIAYIRDIAKSFFYTVVTNYSIQSFVASNYKCRTTGYSLKRRRDVSLPLFHKNSPTWINSIFHKNDGYVRSIVLNPFRNNGVIDMENELELSKYRIVGNLIDSLGKRPVLGEYELQSITFKLDRKYVIRRFHVRSIKDLLARIEPELLDAFSETNAIMAAFGINVWCRDDYHKDCSPESQMIGLLYLKEKLKKIVETYDVYKEYRKEGKKSIYHNDFNSRKINLMNLCCELQEDPSHIATKIKQTVNFLQVKSTLRDIDWVDSNKGFSYFDYEQSFGGLRKNLNDIINKLPPRFFKYEIYLKKGSQRNIKLTKLSSGEQQLLQTISTHVYHIRNLMSVPKERIKYNNINLVFDEAELCFHMEYQRIFVNTLVDTLRQIQEMDKSVQFNVLIVTHSPFLLSDIVDSQILYLEEGKTVEKVGQQTFAANLNDLVKNTFFLKNGFFGEFSKGKIESLVKFLQSKKEQNNSWDNEIARSFIHDIVSEPIVKECLNNILEGEGDECNESK